MAAGVKLPLGGRLCLLAGGPEATVSPMLLANFIPHAVFEVHLGLVWAITLVAIAVLAFGADRAGGPCRHPAVRHDHGQLPESQHRGVAGFF